MEDIRDALKLPTYQLNSLLERFDTQVNGHLDYVEFLAFLDGGKGKRRGSKTSSSRRRRGSQSPRVRKTQTVYTAVYRVLRFRVLGGGNLVGPDDAMPTAQLAINGKPALAPPAFSRRSPHSSQWPDQKR